ncbi:MAG: DegV family EDD domain-containing protein [Anaerolineae bacterium]|nr:DegV family EDD domain-containing protein [Anaerolineae bacterium]NIN96620.1 DegV family EDD domain-containing protein [Anaerolineae bacterium]NIQ79653.1 DegV family EDD domain-containing protein [Anaerolineae bacterium]
MDGSKIGIVTDSSCDLSRAEANRLGVVLVPLAVSFGPETYLDGELSHDGFWEKAEGPYWPTSSQPSVGAFEEAFAPLVDEGCHVLCLTLTSHHSGSYSSAWAAAQRFGDSVTVVDSLSVSAGLAWQVKVAVEAAEQGMALEDITALLRDMSRRTRLFAVVDTVEYVRRGGRVAKVMPILGRMMKAFDVKLMLKMVDGELDLLATQRSYEKALNRIQAEVISWSPVEKLGILHTRLLDHATSFAHTLAASTGFPVEQITISEAGPALATHAGPRVIGAFVLRQTVGDE